MHDAIDMMQSTQEDEYVCFLFYGPVFCSLVLRCMLRTQSVLFRLLFLFFPQLSPTPVLCTPIFPST